MLSLFQLSVRKNKMISREQALQFLNENIENRNIIKHMLAAEAMMRALAGKLQTADSKLQINEDEWGMVGLLHDGDYIPSVPPEKQGIAVVDMLKAKGYEIPDNVAHSMASHNHMTGIIPVSKMDWAIFCGDSLTGLIVASVLVLPSRKLSDLTVENVLNGTRREDIIMCEEKLGFPLSDFVTITLKAMQGISEELGL
jgi:predicted hydrolase (HD superfamily)